MNTTQTKPAPKTTFIRALSAELAKTTRQHSNATFGANLMIRIAALRGAGLIRSNADLADAGGLSRQFVGSVTLCVKVARLSTVGKFALLVGAPASALLDDDGGTIANYPLPDFDWLRAIAENRDALGFDDAKPSPEWSTFAAAARGLYPNP